MVRAGEEEARGGKEGNTQELETNEGAKRSEGEKISEEKKDGDLSQAEQQRPSAESKEEGKGGKGKEPQQEGEDADEE